MRSERPLTPALPTRPLAPSSEAILRAVEEGWDRLPEIHPHIFWPERTQLLYLPIYNVPVNVNPAQTSTLISFLVPGAHQGRLTHFGNGGSDLTNLRWNLMANQSGLPPVSGLVGQLGTVAAPLELPAGGIWVEENKLIELSVTNTGLGVISGVQAVLIGFLYAAESQPTQRGRW
jgi:hypothetical protein